MKRTFIDNKSYANTLFLEILREMQILESSIVCNITILIGLNDEHKIILEEIKLMVYIEGVNLHTKFLVMECPSVYNISIGRLWTHEIKIVSSTYH